MARGAVTKASLKKAAKQSMGFDPASAQIVFDNVAALIDQVRAEKLKSVFLKAGTILRDRARTNAPYRTGKLRSAIFVDEGKPQLPNVLVGVNLRRAPHAYLVENGTSKAKPKPYFRTAITTERQNMAKVIFDGLVDSITKAIK